MTRFARKGIRIFVRWLDFQLWGPRRPPNACEYRRPARITYYRHGERKHGHRAA
jgi:hypothetical protein